MPVVSASASPRAERNWAGNQSFDNGVARITSFSQLQRLLAQGQSVRAIGSRHSFSAIAQSDGTVVDLSAMAGHVEVDSTERTARVSPGTTFAQLSQRLSGVNLALENLGSLPHISIIGACSTGTHGSGDRNGVLATAVSAVELMTADGSVTRFDRRHPSFNGVPASLGCLGIVTSVELSLVPSFTVAQYVLEDLDRERMIDEVLDILAFAYSVSIFTTWGSTEPARVWVKCVDRSLSEAPFGTQFATTPNLSPLGYVDTNLTTQGGVPGLWSERLPHFRADAPPSSGNELQSEYFVDRRHTREALAALEALDVATFEPLLISEIRSVRADELWLSPASAHDTVAIHFTWVNDDVRVRTVLPAIEEALKPFAARPHWGKLHGFGDDVGALFPRWSEFLDLRREMDPAGRFLNAYLIGMGLSA